MPAKRPHGRRSTHQRKRPTTGKEPHFAAEVRDLNSRGHGVVPHPDGRVFFVAGVWTGEHGVFEIIQSKGRSGHARLLEITRSAPERQSAPCPHHGVDSGDCGGCPWMFMPYAAQLAAKERRVARALSALDASHALRPMIASPQALGYRNRAQLKTDGRLLGYVTQGSRQLAEISDCLVLSDSNRGTLQALRKQLPNKAWCPPRGKQWTSLDFDEHVDADSVQPNAKRPFMQGNSAQNQVLRQWLADTLEGIDSKQRTLELFCGSGNLTEIAVAAGCAQITAIDSFAPAVAALDARKMPGVDAMALDIFREASLPELESAVRDAELLLLDPPREGFKTLDHLLRAGKNLRWIIYISCDLATWQRDTRGAIEAGFTLLELRPLDMFPQTPHIELLSLLGRLDSR